ncbi:MAG: hypothetical protein Q7U75_10545 [Desulfobacterales bacterium]|nr:hypothetical protein [Desulfobacterales bacterium]
MAERDYVWVRYEAVRPVVRDSQPQGSVQVDVEEFLAREGLGKGGWGTAGGGSVRGCLSDGGEGHSLFSGDFCVRFPDGAPDPRPALRRWLDGYAAEYASRGWFFRGELQDQG